MSLFLITFQYTSVNINGSVIKSSNREKLLGITIYSDLAFEEHINKLCQKASQKPHALSRISKYLSQHKRFNYRPLVWMCHGRCLNNKISNIHKRALRIMYQDKKSNLQDLLKKDKSASIHMKTLQYLAIEIYEVQNSLFLEIMKEVLFLRKMKIMTLGVVLIYRIAICIQRIL